jgi:hypothetical protein
MTSKTKKIINWVLAGIIGLVFLGSGINKLMASAEALTMAEGFGISAGNFKMLGIIEVSAVLLFLYPRTGILGTLLLVAYMGGAIATHLEHGQPIIAPIIISAVLWIVAVNRFQELTQRIKGV